MLSDSLSRWGERKITTSLLAFAETGGGKYYSFCPFTYRPVRANDVVFQKLITNKGGKVKRIAWIALNLLVLTPAHAANFDCRKATTHVEKIICGDAELSRLDEELGVAYKAALRDVKHADAIKLSQKQWLKQRNSCTVAGCVKGAYEKQLSLLNLPFVTVPAGTLITGRVDHTATLLSNGKVLIAGGCCDEGEPFEALGSAELYDPATNRFTATGNLVEARREHFATLLPNGKVLVSGGSTRAGRMTQSIDGVELYDPASGSFSTANSFPSGGTVTPLANGKVLFAGGDHANLYDPVTGHFTPTVNPPPVRDYTATLLQNGQVLFVGGDTAELYDPATNRFTITESLPKARTGYTATLLLNGKVLVAGGAFVDTDTPLTSAELYDPATGRFSPTGELVAARFNHRAILLPNGKVLIAAGNGASAMPLSSLELYDPATGTFSSVGRLSAECDGCTVTLLNNGTVLFINGNPAELYDPAAGNQRRH